jgi:hypothetical protein
MPSGPPGSCKRDSFLDELATRLGVAANAPPGMDDDDDRPTTPQKRLTEDMELPDFTGEPRRDRLELSPRERQLGRPPR